MIDSTEKEFTGVKLLILGCGSRGINYASYAQIYPEKARVVAISDTRTIARKKFLQIYDTIEKDKIFSDWKEALNVPSKLADCVIIALPDQDHKEAAIAFMTRGYHMLLEKPMATSLEDCKKISEVCRQHPHQINAVCHVLRYYPACLKIKEIIESGILGNIVNINHTEPIGYEHFSHSFVRGNWHKESESSFSLLSKCCHDIDLIVFWMGEKKKCEKVSSFGSLFHFKKENAPQGATKNCFDCPHNTNCCYSAKSIYTKAYTDPDRWPCSVVLSTEIENLKDVVIEDLEDLSSMSIAEKKNLLERCLTHEDTKYGRCVYKMDNDVCDNQIVSMQFSDKSTATLNMIAFSQALCQRKTIVYGTKGQLEWDDHKAPNQVILYDFLTKETKFLKCDGVRPSSSRRVESEEVLAGHGGADFWLMQAFVEAVLRKQPCLVTTDIMESLKSHIIVFAAEQSRLRGEVVCIENV